MLVIIAAILFASWEVFLEKNGSVQEPIFSLSILKLL